MASQLASPLPELSPDERRELELYRCGALTQHRPLPAWRLALEAVVALRSLVSLAVLGLVVLLAISLLTVSGSLDQRLSGAFQRTGQSLTAAGQAVSDVFNPTHPPRYAISQDTEFASLRTISIGDALGQSDEFTYTLMDIRRREDASGNPDFAQYAVIQRQYRVPRETKLLGITVHVDRGEQQYILDRGETFRLGDELNKVNWISAAERRLAVASYRHPDEFAGRLAFDGA
ncbi:MAG: hypothetical protein JOZ39_02890 [Chloroflexi bacterium]|nr:hypothetical protein [Chloroflexota bacterium]